MTIAIASTPLVSLADTGRITCASKDKNLVKVIEFNSDSQTVVMDGDPMKDVRINKREIRFTLDIGVAGQWPMQIDRLTGVMLIKIPGKDEPGMPTHLAPLGCEKASQKF
jgi:hypothetical protein